MDGGQKPDVGVTLPPACAILPPPSNWVPIV